MDHAVSAKIQEIDSQLDAEIQTSGADPDSMTAFELCISSFIAKWFEPCFVHKLKVVKGGFWYCGGQTQSQNCSNSVPGAMRAYQNL